MIQINSFEYYGPYIIEPSRHFFESMLRCDTPLGELISKNLIIFENGRFDAHPFPLLKQERMDLVGGYMKWSENSPTTYYMVDAYVNPEHEKDVRKLLETDCYQRKLFLMVFTEETRIAMQQLGRLETVYCVAHLNELDSEGNLLPEHFHMTFRPKESPSKETLEFVKEVANTEVVKV